VLTFEQPYDRDAGLWEPDDHTPTRLGEPQVTLRLAGYTNGRVTPWCADPDTFRAWCLSEISVRASRVADVVEEPEIAPSITALRAQWSRWDRNTLVLVLRPLNATTWQGRIVDRRAVPCGVTYNRATGWTWD
jgi:CRISPR-associated endonuclease/helicase Cas3